MAKTYYLHNEIWTVNTRTVNELKTAAPEPNSGSSSFTFTAAGQTHSIGTSWISAADEFSAGVPAGNWTLNFYIALLGGGGTIDIANITAYERTSAGGTTTLFSSGAFGSVSAATPTLVTTTVAVGAWTPAAGSALEIFVDFGDPTFGTATQGAVYWDDSVGQSNIVIPTPSVVIPRIDVLIGQ